MPGVGTGVARDRPVKHPAVVRPDGADSHLRLLRYRIE